MGSLVLSQELHHHGCAICCAEFAPTGGLFATGGHDGRVLVYRTAGLAGKDTYPPSQPLTPRVAGMQGSGGAVLEEDPFRVCVGHTGAVVDLSWGPAGQRLVTASADGTVRLWTPHTSGGCQAAFQVCTAIMYYWYIPQNVCSCCVVYTQICTVAAAAACCVPYSTCASASASESFRIKWRKSAALHY